MKRFFKELFNRRLRCERLGHNYVYRKAIIRRKGNSWRDICVDLEATLPRCKHCGDNPLTPKDEKQIESYQSVTMPDDMWDELRENGFLIMRWR